MKIYLCGAAFIAALGATAGPAGAQAISGKPVQTAQAETTIYRTTARERFVTKRQTKSGKVVTVQKTAPVVTRERIATVPVQRVVTAPPATVRTAAAPLVLAPDQRRVIYRALAEDPSRRATVITEPGAPLVTTEPETTGFASGEIDLIGSRIPPNVQLYPMPEDTVSVLPDAGRYRYAVIDEQMYVVDLDTGIIVASFSE